MNRRFAIGIGYLVFALALGTLPAWASDTIETSNPGMAQEDALLTRIKAVFDKDTRIELHDVKVSRDGETIHLDGSVMTAYERAHAEHLAGDVPGVDEIVNEIRVVKPVNPDFAMAKKIRANILRNPVLQVSKLKVEVKDRNVSLWGIVSTEDQRTTVGHFIHGMTGVNDLQNHLVVAETQS